MPTLARRKDGAYIVRHHYHDFATWQLTTDGLYYLRRRDVQEDDQFTSDQFMHLWMNAWVYTGEHPHVAQGPVVIGDRDVPSDLRVAIDEFHAALWNHNREVVWCSTFEALASEMQYESLKTFIPDVSKERFQQWRMTQFCERLGQSGMLSIQQWQLRDIRTVVLGYEYIATVGARFSSDGRATPHKEWDETWVCSPPTWRIKWDQVHEAG